VHAICHAHTIAGRAWSAFAKPLEMLTQDICNFYKALAIYGEYGGIVFGQEEGRNIAKALGAHNKVCSPKSLQFKAFISLFCNLCRICGKHSKKSLPDVLSQAAILMNHGLLTVGTTVDEAGFLFGALDRGCAIQLQIDAACAGNPSLEKRIINDEEAAYNFKMASEKNSLYAEAQPDIEYEIEMAGGLQVLGKGVEAMAIDA
jgi:ribulose-5-phosphate 4-epimerase/fuculose-1-phosphate aldolase